MIIRYDDLGPNLLVQFYKLAHFGGANGSLLFGQWDAIRPQSISNTLIGRKIRSLIEARLILEEYSEGDPQFQTPEISISDAGIAAVDSALNRLRISGADVEIYLSDTQIPESLIDELRALIEQPTSRAIGPAMEIVLDVPKHASKDIVVPASDRFVELDHNSAPYREAISALDAAISEAEKSNSLGDLTAGERISILSQLKTGRTLFDDNSIRVSAYRAVLDPALKWLLEKCADNVVGLAITAAITAIGTLLGLAG